MNVHQYTATSLTHGVKNYIHITGEDLHQFTKTLKRPAKLKIYNYFVKKIIPSLPERLRSEIKCKYTNFISAGLISESPNYEGFRFMTKRGSAELNELLSTYSFILKHDR